MEENGERFRSAAKSLPSRARKRLTGNEDWFKAGRKRKRETEEGNTKDKKRKKTDCTEPEGQ